MTDQEFQELQLKLEHKISEVNELQRLYRNETGRDFVPPLRLGPIPCMFCGGTEYHKESCRRS